MPPKAFLKETSFALCGRLERTAANTDLFIKKHGGEVTASVTSSTTALITTAAEASGTSVKVVTAKEKGVPIIAEGYLDACLAAKTLLPTGPYSLVKTVRKRKAAAPKARKKARVEVKTTDEVEVLPKSGFARKAAVVIDGVDSWDCDLLRHNPAKHIDWYYRMQLLATPSHKVFHVVTHWGITGGEGQVHTTTHKDLLSAQRRFRSKFVQRSGVRWKDRDTAIAVDGKYVALKRESGGERARGVGTWEYYMDKISHGKGGRQVDIGWHAYEEGPNAEMERLWRQSETNEGIGVRLLDGGKFRYEVNLDEMIQTNQSTGTRRVIRRVAPGETGSTDAPAHIPEKVAPVAAPLASCDVGDDKDDGHTEDKDEEEDEDEDEDEEEPEEEAVEDEDAETTAKAKVGEETIAPEPAVRVAPPAPEDVDDMPAPARSAPESASSADGGRQAEAGGEIESEAATVPAAEVAGGRSAADAD